MRLAQESQYNKALHLAQGLKLDMTDVFIHLTNQCIRLTRNPGSTQYEPYVFSVLSIDVYSS